MATHNNGDGVLGGEEHEEEEEGQGQQVDEVVVGWDAVESDEEDEEAYSAVYHEDNDETAFGRKDLVGVDDVPAEFVVPDGFNRISPGAFKERSITSIVIPDSVLSIGREAFNGCDELASVSFGNGITSIDMNAFSDTAITSIVLPDSLTAIGFRAFNDCWALASVSLGNGITFIDEGAFRSTAITAIVLPNSLTTLGNYSFMNCNSLASIILPDGLSEIADYAFSNTALTSITIPRSVRNVEFRAFSDCASLISFNVAANTTIHPRAFGGCVALEALAARYDMDVNTYVVQLPIILRAPFYHFLLCERVSAFLMSKDDIMKVIAGFLFIYPEAPGVARDYVLPTPAYAAERLAEQLELQRQDKEKR
jgi:hypothetical protein